MADVASGPVIDPRAFSRRSHGRTVRAVALIYRATLSPTKPELLTSFLATRPWAGDTSSMEVFAAYRFDDPAGEVGIETHLVRTAAGAVLQVPTTYRAAPLDGAEEDLIATMEHSVLGRRWAYDGCADPVYLAALLETILTGGREAQLWVDDGSGDLAPREPQVRVSGSGQPGTAVPALGPFTRSDERDSTVVEAAGARLTVRRVLDPGEPDGDGPVLLGSWAGAGRTVLARAAV